MSTDGRPVKVAVAGAEVRGVTVEQRITANVLAAVALLALTAWWVLLPHGFSGPVLLALTPEHGVHEGDLPSLVFLLGAARAMSTARRLEVRAAAR